MSAHEWLILAGWLVTIAALVRWAARIDRQEDELEHNAEMQNWPEG